MKPPFGTKPLTMTRSQARTMALEAQLLSPSSKLPIGKEGVAQAIDQLGYIQIDTIAVVRRAHHHTLRTRRADYEEEMLDGLQAKDRRIFEYWGHAASYLPMSDYRYYLPLMRSFYELRANWFKKRFEKHGHLMQPVLERIAKEGPLGSRDFGESGGPKRNGWWDWKPTKTALELLFWRGELMVRERRNFQRIYDLTERVLPGDIDTSVPDDGELGRFFVRRALQAYGLAEEKDIRQHIPAASGQTISRALHEMIQEHAVAPVSVGDDQKSIYFTLVENLARVDHVAEGFSEVAILSPFDNLIIQRDRTKRLFGFDYTLECYVPAAKRKYGYFVLPILWGDRFVGRLDAKAEQATATLILRNLEFEKSVQEFEALVPALAEKLQAFAAFNCCERVRFERVRPAKLKAVLRRGVPDVDSPSVSR